ncbi:hypothetical protein [Silvanigrella aquatica]|uniref:Uncharacterized protein n=1 Tax=Silvanigrella aquatica TaxID=1915309 RepID=A0A1L4D458_9BACT|nr:hypothetical protein [Silvanigrella aquatica]APJ04991.1 hypothetical protein AXG55_14260 [Silvanigrella aquatica]
MSNIKRFKVSKLVFIVPIILLISDFIIPYSKEIQLFVTSFYFIGSFIVYYRSKFIIFNEKYIVKNYNLSILCPKIVKIRKEKIIECTMQEKIFLKYFKIKFIKYTTNNNSEYCTYFYR